MDVQKEESYERSKVMDLSSIQQSIPITRIEDLDTPESIDKPSMWTDIVEADLGEDSW